MGQSPIILKLFLMNVLQLQINDVVFFDDELILITDIEFSSISCTITFDILDDSLFHIKTAWSFFVIYKSDYYKDFFTV